MQFQRDGRRRGDRRVERELDGKIRSDRPQLAADESRINFPPTFESIERAGESVIEPDSDGRIEFRGIQRTRKDERCRCRLVVARHGSRQNDLGQSQTGSVEVDRQRRFVALLPERPVVQSGGLHVEDHVPRRKRDVERRPRGSRQVVQQPRRQLLLAERDERRLLGRDIGLRFLPCGP